MSNTRLLHARTRVPLLVLLLIGLVVPLGGTPSASAQSAQPLWSSEFGDGARTALDSLGDRASATVWNDRNRSSFGTFQGRDAWQVDLPRDQMNGTKVRARFQDLGFAPRDAIRLEYDVFIASEAALGLDLKLPGIASAPSSQSLWYASSGGDKRADSASVRMHTRPAGNFGVQHPYLDVYAYAHRGGAQSFQQWGLYWRLAQGLNATGRSTGDEFRIPIGEWFTITLEAEMNSAGANDGELRVWLNGRKGVDLRNMEWVRSAPYVWTQTMFETFYNGGSHPASQVRIANMTMSPIGGSTTAPVAPPAPAPVAAPVAAFTAGTTSVEVGRPVTFDASGSQRAVGYAWDDATPGDWPLGTGRELTFTFRTVGTKNVRLTVTDAQGRTDRQVVPITVTAAREQPAPVAPPEPPTAAFSFTPSNPRVGQTVTLDASGSQRGIGYAWDDATPGDWPLGSGERLAFTFRSPGTKQVRLTVTDAQGRTDTVTRPVTVVQPPPSTTTRWNFDGGSQGWEPGRDGVQVTHDRSVTHLGAGSLRGRARFAPNSTGVVRFRSAGVARDWSSAGGELGTWVYVPANAGGSDWRARIEIQNSSDWAYATGPLQTVRPGTWTYVSHDFGPATRDVFRVAVQVQAWNVGGDRNVYIDTVRQRP